MKPRSAGRRKKRRPWTSDELRSLFQSPVYVGCQSDTRRRSPGSFLVWDHDYWLPLLAVFSGARLGELFQLRVVDVKCEEGIYAFDMLDLSDDDEDDEDDKDNSASSTSPLPKRRFKNEASRRLVPIHPQLLTLGFLEYVERQRQANEVLLFPKLNASRDLDAAKKSWSQWFGRYRRKPVGVTSDRTDFHSFRHGFKDRVRAVTQSDEIRNRICGHSAKRVGETYGQGDSLRTLSDVMNEVSYPGLDLSHLEIMTRQTIALRS